MTISFPEYIATAADVRAWLRLIISRNFEIFDFQPSIDRVDMDGKLLYWIFYYCDSSTPILPNSGNADMLAAKLMDMKVNKIHANYISSYLL